MWIWERKSWDSWPPVAGLPLCSGRTEVLQTLGGRLVGRIEMLPPLAAGAVQSAAVATEAAASMAIEGVLLDADSVRQAANQMVAGRQGLRWLVADRRAEGITRVVWDARSGWGQPLTAARLCRWQRAILEARPTPGVTLGRFRSGGVAVQAADGTIHYQAPPAARIEAEVGRFIEWFEASRDTLPGPVRAGIAHAWFELLHPFDDGNGRVGRAVADLALSQALGGPLPGYLSATVAARQLGYYRQLAALGRSERDLGPWLDWWLETVELGYKLASEPLKRVRAVVVAGDQLRPRQVAALTELALGGDTFTPSAYREAVERPERTARRDLAALVEAGIVAPVEGSAGRSRRYRIIC